PCPSNGPLYVSFLSKRRRHTSQNFRTWGPSYRQCSKTAVWGICNRPRYGADIYSRIYPDIPMSARFLSHGHLHRWLSFTGPLGATSNHLLKIYSLDMSNRQTFPKALISNGWLLRRQLGARETLIFVSLIAHDPFSASIESARAKRVLNHRAM